LTYDVSGLVSQGFGHRDDEGRVLKYVAAQTAGLLPSDLSAVVADAAAHAALRRISVHEVLCHGRAASAAGQSRQEGVEGAGAADEGKRLAVAEADFEEGLSAVRRRTAAAIGGPEVWQ
jgi:hypothetical protein